jgi:hypothetical protein
MDGLRLIDGLLQGVLDSAVVSDLLLPVRGSEGVPKWTPSCLLKKIGLPNIQGLGVPRRNSSGVVQTRWFRFAAPHGQSSGQEIVYPFGSCIL